MVRRLVPGETGPTGGPAFTDLLGELLSWPSSPDGAAVVRSADGSDHEIALDLIVSGKPVPPRASSRMRVSAEELQLAAARSFPSRDRERLGSWLLRDDVDLDPYTGDARRVARRTSALAVGDPGMPLDEAVGRVETWYAARGRRAWASAIEGLEPEMALRDAGWQLARREAPTETWIGSVSQVLRALAPYAHDEVELVRLAEPADEHVEVWQASVPDGRGATYPALAHGRSATDPADLDTVGILGLVSSHQARRRGLARAVLHALLERAAEEGARTLWLHVLADSEAATELYASIGLSPHHRTVYLAAPEAPG